MAVGASFLSMGELDMSIASVKGRKALSYAESCIDEGLRRIMIDPDFYADSQPIVIGDGQCLLTVSGSGNSRTIIGAGSADVYQKKIEADLSFSGQEININNWQEKNN